MTLFTTVTSLAGSPVAMHTIVIVNEILPLTPHEHIPPPHTDATAMPVDNPVRTGDESILIPLITRAVLPQLTADVTELGTT